MNLVERLHSVSFMLQTAQTMGDIIVGKGEAPFEAVDEAIAEISRLQKALETAREDALEEAANFFDLEAASGAWHSSRISTAIRNLKDKEVAG